MNPVARIRIGPRFLVHGRRREAESGTVGIFFCRVSLQPSLFVTCQRERTCFFISAYVVYVSCHQRPYSTAMGLSSRFSVFNRRIKRTVFGSVLTSAVLVGYLEATTSMTRPLAQDDRIWSSDAFSKYNKHRNPSTQDIVIKRIPLSKICPELLWNEGDLAVEFCRGIWSGLGSSTRPSAHLLA